MDIMSINFIVLIAIPEAIATIFLGLYLLGVKASINRVVVAGVLQAILLFFIKKYADFGVGLLMQTISVVVLTYAIVKVTPLCSLVSNLIGTAINVLLEAANLIIFLKLSQLTFPEIISRDWLRIAYNMPKLGVLLLIIVICLKYKITLEEELTFVEKINRHIKI